MASSVFKTVGEFDYTVVLATRDNSHLQELINEIKAIFPDKIRSMGVVPIVD